MNILLGYGYHTGTTGFYLERSFAKQHKVTYVGTPWGERAGFAPNVDLAALMAELPERPNIFVYIDSGGMPGGISYFPRGLEAMDIPTACYLIDVYPPGTGLPNKMRLRMAAFFDYVFVAQRGCLDLFAADRRESVVHWLPLACDPDIQRDLRLERIYDIGFVGKVTDAYRERAALLQLLSSRYRMNDYHRCYFGEEMARIYSQSKIVVNLTLGGILNMRVFEAPACGALLLTERSDNGQDELFRDGEHIITFKGQDELLALVEHYLSNEVERERTARAGQEWVIAHHTYDHRAAQLLETVFGAGQPKLTAPIRSLPEYRVRLAYAKVYSMLRLVDAVIDELRALRRLGKGRLLAAGQLLYAILRRIKYN